MIVFSVLIISRLDSQSKFQMLTLFSGRRTTEVKQRGVSILGFLKKKKKTFRRISEVWENAQA